MNAKPETISWHERARSLSLRTQAFIEGRYVDAASGVTFDSINPATGKLLARVASGDTEDINRAVATLPSAITDIQNGITQANNQLQQRNTPHQTELNAARDAAVAAVADAQKNGSADPLGAFTRLTKADADLDRLLASVSEEREAAERVVLGQHRQIDQLRCAADRSGGNAVLGQEGLVGGADARRPVRGRHRSAATCSNRTLGARPAGSRQQRSADKTRAPG